MGVRRQGTYESIGNKREEEKSAAQNALLGKSDDDDAQDDVVDERKDILFKGEVLHQLMPAVVLVDILLDQMVADETSGNGNE